MDRREFLITSGGAAVATATVASSQATENSIESSRSFARDAAVLRLDMPWADTPQGPADSARRLIRRFETMTGGRYRIEITSGGGLAGDADILLGSAHDFATFHPAFSYFAGLPGSSGLRAADFAHWLAVGGGQMLWDDLAGEQGWKPLLAGHSGEAPPLWSREPITGVHDLSGRRVVAFGLGADVARALGADGLSLTPDQVAGAFSDDTVFAAEVGGLLTSLAGGTTRSARHATGSGLNGHGTALSLSVRLSVWDRLPDADKAILEAVTAEAYQASLAEARAHERLARQVLESSFGVTFAPWPSELAEALDRVAEATIAHVAGRDAIAARIDQSYMAFRSAISGSAGPRRSPAAMPIA
jgi:TRAP-type mannitol/chloroaromatic compound transport system substrate-binding protein